ncbi:c-type cytochrome [Altibacter sp. HG106]|uniref:c-type cytochrome n=1 Tax=Altibacter sp. HG106 TaxID=3023937 RepID=UPI00234FF33D|nr:cytochrome c [Altibacter sp. HG106]MDC7994667.1 cytochrome c [Altibacter sp. HG106]
MKKLIPISLAFGVALLLVSCFNESDPNYQYMPNMYAPVGYETYGEYSIFEDQQEAMLPPEGTIPRGWRPYDYENSTEGLERARAELTSPLPVTEENLAAGAQLYTIYCAVCHGDKGDGQGILAQREKFLGIPSYDDPGRNITEGSIYHVQMYGLNTMGSYASQTNELERWQITQHVLNLKAALKGEPELTPQSATDSTATVKTTVEGEVANTETNAEPDTMSLNETN